MNSKFTMPLDLVDKPILLENKSQMIVYANKKALERFEELNHGWEPNRFRDHFTFYGDDESLCISNKTQQLFTSQEETVSIDDLIYKKITLIPLSDSLDPLMLNSYMQMAEKFVHQFRSPLTGSHGYLEMLLENYNPAEELAKNYTSKIEEGLNQSFLLLDQIEDFATPVTTESSTFSLNSFILSVFEDFTETEISQVSIEKPDRAIEINSDYYLLRKIIVELLKNGLEANLDLSGKKVSLKFHENGVIEVQNKLLDFPGEDLKRIFLPFFSTKALQMGLGLPKCRLYCQKLHLDFRVCFDVEEKDISFKISGYPFSIV